jgi:hypothetical protein
LPLLLMGRAARPVAQRGEVKADRPRFSAMNEVCGDVNAGSMGEKLDNEQYVIPVFFSRVTAKLKIV